MDEVHLQQHGSRCRLWIPPEVADPVCRHAPTRKRIRCFGAVRRNDGKLVMSRPHGKFNALTCWDFYRKLKRPRRPGRKMVGIIDHARYHHARRHTPWRPAAAKRFCLHLLPRYSPELNPIERVWKLVRRRCLHNRYFAVREEVVQAVEPLFRIGSRPNATLKRLCGIL